MKNIHLRKLVFIAIGIAFATFLYFDMTSVRAQVPTGIINSGDAAVTGFSGTVMQPPSDYEFIDINGPSLRVLSLPEQGKYGLVTATKKVTVKARDIGQVFGVVLDNGSPPNIYVSATSAYGIALYKEGGGRIEKGEADAQYVPGLFGPDNNPANIYRIDGKTGSVSVFATVSYNGSTNMPAALGALAFDAASQQIFVSDRSTGMIHRFALDGTDNGVYDHGVQGLSATGQATVPFDVSTIGNIKDAHFDTKDPETWGYAPVGRRVYALATANHRLYYAVYGAQIWSVGINQDGSFANDPRIEIDSPPLTPNTEISSITFDGDNSMFIAERGAPTGDEAFMNVAQGGQNRVLHYVNNNGWKLKPSGGEYAIGMPPDYQNADGGVAIKCSRIVWATGERLLEIDAQTSPHIDGLQGTNVSLIKPANTPPKQSWYVNYYDKEADPASRGHMGAIAILNVCQQSPSVTTPGVVVTPPIACPPGTFFVNGNCLIPPICPPGTEFFQGYCIYAGCPCGYVRIRDRCVPPPVICDWYEVYVNDRCYPVDCPPNTTRATRDYCRCPDNATYRNGRCEPECPPEQFYRNGRCTQCPPHQTYRGGRCTPEYPPCPTGQTYQNGRCLPPPYNPPCPLNQTRINGQCKPTYPCGPNQSYVNGRCITRIPCGPNQTLLNGHCVTRNPCGPNQTLVNGHCVTRNPCGPNQTLVNGHCVTRNPCGPNQTLVNGHCVTRNPCGPNQTMINGRCVPKRCPWGKKLVNGICVSIPGGGITTVPPVRSCPDGYVRRNGTCIKIRVINPLPYFDTPKPRYPLQPPRREITPPSTTGGTYQPQNRQPIQYNNTNPKLYRTPQN